MMRYKSTYQGNYHIVRHTDKNILKHWSIADGFNGGFRIQKTHTQILAAVFGQTAQERRLEVHRFSAAAGTLWEQQFWGDLEEAGQTDSWSIWR